jgi:hypothetical protein
VTGNRDLAAGLRDQADAAVHRRKVLLCASVALAETSTIAAARKVLHDWDGPAAIRDAAIELLGQLTQDVPAAPGDGETSGVRRQRST